ncbi:signal transduction histidine kinase [Streptomyces griseochromogenes]|uniref:histidine kinase n=1 Tax=Streptomyces griseochromogenes TaxID=68214 RepID=A0A1B1AYJ7_9ACTN|nr:histidine kinase [Streptomyces griseochromogenes]ANP51625.1 hypothetical protein AVL59_20295 [Streptomyces griseochromogenes]MBP2054271.1 signal transduction histidine kinase [Streptomyces griseochromogenes]
MDERWERAVPQDVMTDAAGLSRRQVAAEVALAVAVAALVAALAWSWPAGAVAAAAAAAVVVPARRRWPLAALGASVILLAMTQGAAFPAAVVTGFAAGRRVGSPRLRPVALAMVVVLLPVALFVLLFGASTGGVSWEEALLFGGVVLLPSFAVGMLAGQRRTLVETLRERNAYLEHAHHLADVRARLEERARIAGEMHDLLGHRLSLMSVYAGGLELACAKRAPELGERAELIRVTSSQALTELRQILGVLRSGSGSGSDSETADAEALEEGAGTRADLERLVESSRQAGIKVSLIWRGEDLTGADARVRRAMHRTAREGLTNLLKHAAAATSTVRVERTGQQVRISVANEAEPQPAPRLAGTGSGLIGVEERIRLLGGVFDAGPTPDGGFRITADLPLAPPAAEADSTPAVTR